MRLNRYLSQCGIASRRGAEQIILEGRVSINGHVIKELATQVESDDKVIVDGKPIQTELPVVLALNKPKGYLCSRGDTHERMTIYDLLPERFQHLHHVGRLDKESEGLLLMTNRGDLSHRLTHPSQGAEKEYEVVVNKVMDQETMARLVRGMTTEEGFAKAERAWLDGGYRCHLVLKQGLKRQIRLMMYSLGFEVERLVRVRIGWLNLRHLQKGGWKQLTPTEVERFFTEDAGQPRRSAPGAKKSTPTAKKVPLSRSVSRQDDFFDDEEAPRPSRNSLRAKKSPGRGNSGPRRASSSGSKKSVGGSEERPRGRARFSSGPPRKPSGPSTGKGPRRGPRGGR